jgi:DNA-binding protein HU-beta
MTKSELISLIAEKGEMTKKDAEKALNAVTGSVTEALSKGEKIQLIGFGTFEVHHRDARKTRSPQTGEMIDVPAKEVPVFKAGKALKDAVNK